MAEYIEREALMEQLGKKKAGIADKRYTEGFNDALMRFRSMVHSAKAADVVEVVRCKDCKYWHESTWFCSKNSYFIDSNEISCSPLESPTWTMWGENDFCSNGEMKDK